MAENVQRRMLLIPVQGEPKMVVAQTLEQMQHFVGGYIERVRVDREWSMCVNEEGLMIPLPPNVRASILYGYRTHGQPILGDALLGKEGTDADGGLDWLDTDEKEVRSWLTTALASR